jgi:hypothetical protein
MNAMIDSLGVADALHDEAKRHVRGMRFSPPESDLGFEKNWEREVAKWPLPEKRLLARIIEHVFWTSLLTEEGRPSRPRLVYAPSRESGYVVHWFTEPKPLTPETLAKLAPACGPLNYLAFHLERGAPLLTGIVSHQGAAPFDLIVAAAGTGAVDLIWNGYRLVTLRSGQLARSSQNRLPNAAVRSPYLAELLGNVSPAHRTLESEWSSRVPFRRAIESHPDRRTALRLDDGRMFAATAGCLGLVERAVGGSQELAGLKAGRSVQLGDAD